MALVLGWGTALIGGAAIGWAVGRITAVNAIIAAETKAGVAEDKRTTLPWWVWAILAFGIVLALLSIFVEYRRCQIPEKKA